MKSGFVSIIGRPNTGKSTLINQIIKEKVAIISPKPQTTRNLIQGIYNEEDTQIVFVDTPGIHKPKTKLGNMLNEQAYYSIEDVDILLFLIDVTKEFGKGDNYVLDKIKQANKPTFLILNKIDKIKKEELFNLINKYKDLYDFKEIVPVSAIKGINKKELINTLKNYLPDTVKYYPDEDLTDVSLEFRTSELIREKILRLTNDEVPHTVSVVINEYVDKKNKVIINATIIVERDSIKSIIIGKNGSMLKEIGTKARIDIEKMTGKKVYLDLFVKTIKNWRDKEKYLKELGFYDIKDE